MREIRAYEKLWLFAAIISLACVLNAIGANGADEEISYNEQLSYRTNNEIGRTPWTAANISKLRALNEAALSKFCDSLWDRNSIDDWSRDNDKFIWVDLAGDGKYQLVLSEVTRCCGFTHIFWQDAPGRIREQLYNAPGDPNGMIKDLNGDGKHELIFIGSLDTTGATWGNALTPVATWPMVFRLRGDRYVEASRDFPSLYDREILPPLEKEIGEAAKSAHSNLRKPLPALDSERAENLRSSERHLAVLVMERDKILRVLGRDPNAGLDHAREWLKSDDPQLVGYAVTTLEEIGGHEQELRASKSALMRLDPTQANDETQSR